VNPVKIAVEVGTVPQNLASFDILDYASRNFVVAYLILGPLPLCNSGLDGWASDTGNKIFPSRGNFDPQTDDYSHNEYK
jgi:hypothetical protein